MRTDKKKAFGKISGATDHEKNGSEFIENVDLFQRLIGHTTIDEGICL